MKNYNVNAPMNNNYNNNESDIVNEHKSRYAQNISKKTNNMEVESTNVFSDELDQLDGLEPLDYPDELESINDEEIKIEKPMWKSNEKRQSAIDEKRKSGKFIDTTPAWQKPPSRMSTGSWLITIIIILIPVVNGILALYWAFFSDHVPDEKRNFSRAFIILSAVFTIVVISLNFSKFGNIPSIADFKSSFSSYTSEISNTAKDSIKSEANVSLDEYSDLKDDDFSKQ